LPSTTSLESWTSKVRVIRPSHGDVPVREVQIDVDEMLASGDWTKNILLEPNDIVYIPPTPGAWLSDRVKSVLMPVVPAVQAYAAPAQIRNLDRLYDSNNRGNGTFLYGTGFAPGY